MGDYLSNVNSCVFYLIVAAVLAFITVMCVIFLVKSYRTGIQIGMDKKVLRKAIVSSATFTLLPSISILLGVIALSGNLGIPFSWLRLSVIGSLQYELQVAGIAADGLGIKLDVSQLNMDSFVTIALVMTLGILGGVFLCIFALKKYLSKVRKAPKKDAENQKGFGAFATTVMFIGLCGAYIGTYVGLAIPREGWDILPILVALIAAGAMAIFEYLIQKKNKKVLENFSLATSMLIAMAGTVLISTWM